MKKKFFEWPGTTYSSCLELLLRLPATGPAPDLLSHSLWSTIQEFPFLTSSLENSYVTTKFMKLLNTMNMLTNQIPSHFLVLEDL